MHANACRYAHCAVRTTAGAETKSEGRTWLYGAGGGESGGWNGLAYFRWHGSPRIYYSDYDEAALATLSERLKAKRQQGIPTWCILDNTALGAALGNALTLTPRLKPVTPAAG